MVYAAEILVLNLLTLAVPVLTGPKGPTAVENLLYHSQTRTSLTIPLTTYSSNLSNQVLEKVKAYILSTIHLISKDRPHNLP